MKNKFLLLAAAGILSSSVVFASNQVPANHNNDHSTSQASVKEHKASNKKVSKKAGKHANHKKKTNKQINKFHTS
ncbi:MAG: hypothetical protein ACQPRJ_01930 [Solitalea-like symbiont of Acarus siro]